LIKGIQSAHASTITAIAYSGDGLRLATADAEGTIKIWADAQKLDSTSTALLTKKGHQGPVRQSDPWSGSVSIIQPSWHDFRPMDN
jgi:WD40 repeat protein